MTHNGKLLNDMLLLATQKFYNKFDKAGKPYILHCLKVMHYVKAEDDEELMCIALGHDLVEDTDVTFTQLAEMGFTHRVIEGIRNMTKMPGETNDEYLERVILSKDSIRVKLADLRHNSDIRRLKGITDKDTKRLIKYNSMFLVLDDKLKQTEE